MMIGRARDVSSSASRGYRDRNRSSIGVGSEVRGPRMLESMSRPGASSNGEGGSREVTSQHLQ